MHGPRRSVGTFAAADAGVAENLTLHQREKSAAAIYDFGTCLTADLQTWEGQVRLTIP